MEIIIIVISLIVLVLFIIGFSWLISSAFKGAEDVEEQLNLWKKERDNRRKQF